MINHDDKGIILIVDDVPTNVKVLLDFLSDAGFEVYVALDGESALEQIEYAQPDLILLDVMMPLIDGFETCRRLKANPAMREIPVIFMTALSETVDKVKGFEVGAVDYITKPLQREEVLARVVTHLTIRNLQKQLQQANEVLEQRVVERTAQLAQANRLLQAEIVERKQAEETLRAIVEGTAAVIGADFLHSLVGYLATTLSVSGALITECVDHSMTRLRTLAYWQDGQLRPNFEYQLAGTPCELVMGGQSCYYPKNIQDLFPQNLLFKPLDIESYLGLPIYDTSGDILGHLAVFDQNAMRSGPRKLDILKIFAARAGAELERQRAEEARQLAYQELSNTNLAYSRFVPKEFLRLLQQKSIVDVKLGDQVQMEMTILFADIRGFTSLSEQMTPRENFNFINSYLNRLSPIIRAHHGFIDKYIGDAIMALFPRTPDNALRAALDMQDEVIRYNQHRAKEGYAPIQIGIGLHTGMLMLGTIGEKERLEGTVISDAVNLASRMERLTKHYDANIAISDETFQQLENLNEYKFRYLGEVQVKGKKQTVAAFEILNCKSNAKAALKWKTKFIFEEGLHLYYKKQFPLASAKFSEVLEHNPQDKATRLYLERANHFMVYGTPPDWNGVESLNGE
ncbi:MAG: response regulator [Ardenticatenaceae bacterium]